MPPPQDERGHTPPVCPGPGCTSCPACGGLYYCTVCNGIEKCMPSNCPGQQMTTTQMNEVHAGRIDYRCGLWGSRTSPDATGRAA